MNHCGNCVFGLLFGEDDYCMLEDARKEGIIIPGKYTPEVSCRQYVPYARNEYLRQCVRKAWNKHSRGRAVDRVYEDLVGPLSELGKD